VKTLSVTEHSLTTNPGPCSRCGSPTEPGFILDATLGGFTIARWIAGEPKRRLLGDLTVVGEESHPLQAFRCSRCGHLELFALGWGSYIKPRE
jgi:hypothetical protein